MKLIYSPHFLKSLRKLSSEKQFAVTQTLKTFEKDPFHHSLRNHKLLGHLYPFRSLFVDRDLRIIYSAQDGHLTILFIDVGTHDQVYR